MPEAQPRYRLLTTLLDSERAPALGGRGGIRRAENASTTAPPGTAQQNPRGGSAGVLWLGVGALRGVLADVSSCRCASPQATKSVIYRACPAHAPRPTPLRGISPQRAPGCEDVGSMICCARRPGCAVPAVAAARSPERSSDEIHPMPTTSDQDLEAIEATALRFCSTRCPYQSDGVP